MRIPPGSRWNGVYFTLDGAHQISSRALLGGISCAIGTAGFKVVFFANKVVLMILILKLGSAPPVMSRRRNSTTSRYRRGKDMCWSCHKCSFKVNVDLIEKRLKSQLFNAPTGSAASNRFRRLSSPSLKRAASCW